MAICTATPLTIRIKANRLSEAHCANRALEDEFWRYTHTDENSDRVGEFAIGTNIGVRDVIGNILQDEKIPGVHIAFGDPYGSYTGAPWRLFHAHRRGGPQIRYLGRRPLDHARRRVRARWGRL
jgi:aminopeptidase